MDYCSCIMHYDFLSTSDELTSLSEVSFQTLTEYKKICESLGEKNHHQEQCKGIPTVLNEAPLFYPRECYQKFTYAPNIAKTKMKSQKARNDLRELVLQQVLLAQKSVYFPNNA